MTDSGLALLKSCSNLQALTFNYCDHISQNGLRHLNGNFLVACGNIKFSISWWASYDLLPVLSIYLLANVKVSITASYFVTFCWGFVIFL